MWYQNCYKTRVLNEKIIIKRTNIRLEVGKITTSYCN